jgi:hypothetical protein
MRSVILSRIAGSEEEVRLSELRSRLSVHAVDLDGLELASTPLEGFLDSSSQGDRELAIEILVDPTTEVVVTAARDGLASVADLLVDAGNRRARPLLVISADNSTPESWSELASEAHPGLVTVGSIADRICVRFPATSGADVAVEPYSAWVIERDENGVVETLFEGVAGVTTTADLQAAKYRKLFCVNGLHLALAVRAWTSGDPLLNHWTAQNYTEAVLIGEAIREAYEAIAESGVNIGPYVLANVERFATTPDRSGRPLGVRRGAPSGDPADLRRRIAERLHPLTTATQSPRLAAVEAAAERLYEEWADDVALGGRTR